MPPALEENLPNLESDIKALVDGQAQADPQMRSTLAYTQGVRPLFDDPLLCKDSGFLKFRR